MVGQRHGFGFPGKGLHGQHRAEDFRPDRLARHVDMREDGGSVERTLAAGLDPLPAHENLGARRARPFDDAFDPCALKVADDRETWSPVPGGAGALLREIAGDPLHQLSGDAFVGDEPRSGDADLPGVAGNRFGDGQRRAFDVGIVMDDLRALSAQFEGGGLDPGFGAGRHDPRAGGGRSGEADLADPRVADEIVAHGIPGSLHDIEQPGRKPRLDRQLCEAQRAVGVISEGLTTTALPAARAGPTFHAVVTIGKFHGMTSPITP